MQITVVWHFIKYIQNFVVKNVSFSLKKTNLMNFMKSKFLLLTVKYFFR